MNFFVVALGGAMGAVLRFWVATAIQHRLDSNFPLGTLTVNIMGSLLIGFCFIVLQEKFHGNEILRNLIIIGVLGGFTTFSAFSLETLNLLQSGFWFKAMFNIIGSVTACIFAAFAGVALGRLAVS